MAGQNHYRQDSDTAAASLLRFFAILAFGVLVFFEVRLLLGSQLPGLGGKVAECVAGVVARDLVSGILGEAAQDSLPAGDGFVEFLESFAQVGLSVAVLIQVRG